MLICDMALWLRSSSPDPDVVELREVDSSLTAYDAVLALMEERKEPYVYKAAVSTPYGKERFYRLSLSLVVPDCQVSALTIVNALLPLLAEDSIDPVSVMSADALSLVRACASDDSASLFTTWCRSALAVDTRLFSTFWNDRRSEIARRRLWLDPESEVSHGNLV